MLCSWPDKRVEGRVLDLGAPSLPSQTAGELVPWAAPRPVIGYICTSPHGDGKRNISISVPEAVGCIFRTELICFQIFAVRFQHA